MFSLSFTYAYPKLAITNFVIHIGATAPAATIDSLKNNNKQKYYKKKETNNNG